MSPDRSGITGGTLAIAVMGLLAACHGPGSRRQLAVTVGTVRSVPGTANASSRVVVAFRSTEGLAAYRARHDLPYIRALMFDCAMPAASTGEVVSQRAEYLGDHHRVSPRPAKTGYGYEVTFDNRLTRLINHRFSDEPAIRTGRQLCFALGDGGEPNRFLSTPINLSIEDRPILRRMGHR